MKLPEFLSEMDRPRRNGLLAGAVLVLLGMAAALWWIFTPRYQLLFGNLREADAAEVTQSLTEWKVPYRYTDGGTGIEVPADQVYDTRMKLVSAGVPSGGHVGFELFNDADFGVTEFAQRVNYQRALQGELERSIAALPGVQSVRVHLTIRRPGLFVGQDDSSKASVAVSMQPGEMLTPQQVAGIRNLVASGVDGLSPAAVVVLGPQGVLGGGSSAAGDGVLAQNEEQAGYEARLRERISDLLGQVFHLRDYRVSVDVRLNFDQVKKVSEHLVSQGNDGNGLLVRRHTSRTGTPAAAEGAAAAPGQVQDEFEYAHGTEREEISRAPGRVERVSVAVLVPPSVDGAQLERLRKLVSAAAGLDSERGDRLEITPIGAESLASAGEGNPVLDADVPLSPAADAIPAVDGRLTPTQLMGWIGFALVGLAIGFVLSSMWRPAPTPLRAEERDAVLQKMRSWLADGGQA
jgi:flagellar M-ring protein FliF